MSHVEDSSIINALQHVSRAIEYLKTFIPTSGDRGRTMARGYQSKLEWILRDFMTTPGFSQEIREAFRKEISADVFEVDDIIKKVPLIPSDQRAPVERLIDCILNGENFTVMEREDGDNH